MAVSKVLDDPADYSAFGVFGEDSVTTYNCRSKGSRFLGMLGECFRLIILLNTDTTDDKTANSEVQSLLQALYIRAFRHIDD